MTSQQSYTMYRYGDRACSVPTENELYATSDNYVRPNQLSRGYETIPEYLDNMYGLSREDFLRSVKQGLRARQNCSPLTPGIRVHENIELDPYHSHSEGDYSLYLKLNQELFEKIVKTGSKRLIPGSLLLITDLNVGNLRFGIVHWTGFKSKVNEFEDKLEGKHPTLEIRPPCTSVKQIHLNMEEKFLVIECNTYFLPYRVCLRNIMRLNWLTVSYFGPILLGKVKTPTRAPYLNDGIIKIGKTLVKIDEDSTWPTPYDLGLNSSQFLAYKEALTQNLTLIHGPPGTGKTYLAVKIVLALLENKGLWREGGNGPLIITCLSNHALDQIGEQLVKHFTTIEDEERALKVPGSTIKYPQILRLGGQSKSNVMKNYLRPEKDMRKKIKMKENDYTAYNIILLTSCGAGLEDEMMTKVKSKIMIVEESAVMTEPQMLATLYPALEQIIMIGDHKQLRPIPAMDESHGLDVSLFERLVLNGFKVMELEEQYLMRSEISRLIIGTVYPNLRDYTSREMMPEIEGIQYPVFFLNHKYYEDANSELKTTSHSNEFEVRFCTSLYIYLVTRGYEMSQITVLTTYNRQVNLLKLSLREAFPSVEEESIDVFSVDGFHSKENDIIIVSLVRSIEDNEIGFMKMPNRACVALSRARIGLYVIGNMNGLALRSDVWKDIIMKLRQYRMIGYKLPLLCLNHGSRQVFTYVNRTCDFRVFNNDGRCCRGPGERNKRKWTLAQREAAKARRQEKKKD